MLTRQQSSGGSNSAQNYQKWSRYNSLTEIDGKDSSFTPGASPFSHSATPGRERKKFVSFTVELQREAGQLGRINRITHVYFGASSKLNLL